MFSTLLLKKKHLKKDRPIPDPEFIPFSKFVGEPIIRSQCCKDDCKLCTIVCPTQAVQIHETERVKIDLGKCIFCGECAKVCDTEALKFSKHHTFATTERHELIVDSMQRLPENITPKEHRFGSKDILHIFKLNMGGCGGCESAMVNLAAPQFNIGKYGLRIVDTPAQADILMIAGAVPPPMIKPLRQAYKLVPDPKIVIAVGACAISGGPFRTPSINLGIPEDIPIDIYFPGCAPMTYSILLTLLKYLKRISPAIDSPPVLD